MRNGIELLSHLRNSLQKGMPTWAGNPWQSLKVILFSVLAGGNRHRFSSFVLPQLWQTDCT